MPEHKDLRYFPLSLKLQDEDCLVVGGGKVATRKIAQLIKFGAKITVIAPSLEQSIREMHQNYPMTLIGRDFSAQHLDRQRLVIAATNRPEINQQVSKLARKKNILVNVVDAPMWSTFIMPAIVDRDPVIVSISSNASSPILTRLLRARLEAYIPSAYGKLAALVARFRPQIQRRYQNARERRRLWERILQGPVEALFYAGQDEQVLQAMQHYLQDTDQTHPTPMPGEVYLIGGGPGDPDLLTFRALRLMQQADVVLYDRLVAKAILALVRQDAERIFVGKQKDQHALSQEQINQKLVDLARKGHRVLRLKGGDPFIFGRGGEEIGLLSKAGIPFQIVPGITAASGCASYAGIPLTHREYAQSCLFITGHLKDGQISLNWESLMQPQQTVVIYMGVHGIGKLSHQLIHRGLSPHLPAAVIEQGTTPKQRVYTGELASLPQIITQHRIAPPAIIILGEVVRLHDTLAWYKPSSPSPLI